jgi:nodulation protein E
VRFLPHVPADSPVPTRYAGWIDEAMLAGATRRWQVDDPDHANQLALVVVAAALADAGLPTDGQTPLDHDLIFGTGHGNSSFQNEAMRAFVTGGYRKIRPTAVVRLMFNRPANIGSIRFRLTGGSFVVSCACASGAVAFTEAFQRVRFGLADQAVAACADTGLDLATFSAWNRLGVLTKHADPATACRPFDRDRDGLVMGEGGAGFVLETLEGARARGATILAEVLGTGLSCDARHIVQPDSAGQVRAVQKALTMAGVSPADLDYINAHGTATDIADVVEAATLREVLGADADRIPVSNTKAQLGHLMGATAGVELAVTLLAMKNKTLPPCRNLDHPDPRCPLNFVRGEAKPAKVQVALKNSFAFGGTNCAVVLGAPN